MSRATYDWRSARRPLASVPLDWRTGRACATPPHFLLSKASLAFISLDISDGGSGIPGSFQLAGSPWVTSRFSAASDDQLFLGDDNGNVVLVDLKQCKKLRKQNDENTHSHYFKPKRQLVLAKKKLHNGTVIDVLNVPGRPAEVLTFSGDQTVKIWDLTSDETQVFIGHEATVRCGSFLPDNSFVFVTGGKDGSLRMWDRRVAEISNRHFHGRRAVLTCNNAFKETNQKQVASITGIACTNDCTVVAGSSNLSSGLKVWDLRKPNLNRPSAWLYTYKVPNMQCTKQGVGFTHLCTDRHTSSIFASARNGRIYEFVANSTIIYPVRILHGAEIKDYYSQIVCSPISDHLLSGSEANKALIWDLQELPRFPEGLLSDNPSTNFQPSFSLGGHQSKVPSVAWSPNGESIATVDVDSNLRVWASEPRSWTLSDNDENLAPAYYENNPMYCDFRRIEKFEQLESRQENRIF